MRVLPLVLLLACGGGESSTATNEPAAAEAPATPTIVVRSVEFGHEVDAQGQWVGGPATEFHANDTVVLAKIRVAGRPREGGIRTRWMWRDREIATADIALGQVNAGVFWSVGQDTAIRANLNVPMLYVGEGYRLEIFGPAGMIGSFPFRVVPPEGARPSRFVRAEMFKSDPRQGQASPTRAFRPDDSVIVATQVALGHGSWFDARVTVNGEVRNELTTEIIGPPDGGEVGNAFFTIDPPTPWPTGQHRVDLILDEQEVAHFDFTVE